MNDPVTAKEMVKRLQRHYIKPGPMPGGIFLPECGLNGTTGNRVDAVYVGFTSTSGRLLVGHEIKVSRADWRHELDQPGKADRWADNCHAWYAVAPSTDIIRPEELPDGWGLMVIDPRTKTRLKTVVKATVHKDREPSWQIVRSIMARLDTLQAQAIHDVRNDADRHAREQLDSDIRKQAERAAEAKFYKDKDILARFAEVFGVELDTWMNREHRVSPERLKEALDLVNAREYVDGHSIGGAIEACRRAVERLEELRAATENYNGTPALISGEAGA